MLFGLFFTKRNMYMVKKLLVVMLATASAVSQASSYEEFAARNAVSFGEKATIAALTAGATVGFWKWASEENAGEVFKFLTYFCSGVACVGSEDARSLGRAGVIGALAGGAVCGVVEGYRTLMKEAGASDMIMGNGVTGFKVERLMGQVKEAYNQLPEGVANAIPTDHDQLPVLRDANKRLEAALTKELPIIQEASTKLAKSADYFKRE